MKCPHCAEATLVMSERQGIEIDYCPQCRGVWLDRGELDKLIERAVDAQPAAAQAVPAQPPVQRRPDFVDSDYGRHQQQGGYYRKRKSWLSEIFD
jgi:Zn-finger nucleic acid-binding protein